MHPAPTGLRQASACRVIFRRNVHETQDEKQDHRSSSLIAAAVLLAPAAAMAHNYTYIEGGFLHRDGDRNQDDESGARIAGSVNLLPQAALFGEYSDTGDISQFSVGGLFRTPINHAFDLVAGASMEHVDNGFDDDTGWSACGCALAAAERPAGAQSRGALPGRL